MGNCLCCDAETPCASAEERSGLLAGKTSALPDTGLEGAFLDSPTSDGRKASMDEIKEEEMKAEQIKAEEKTSVTAQVRQGENTPSMPQENGVVQKDSTSMEAAAAPPARHQTGTGGPPHPQLQKLSAAEAPDAPATGAVVTAPPEERTAEVAEERGPSPLNAALEVTEAPCDITSSTAEPVCEGAGGRRNSQGLCEEGPPPAPLGSSPEKISNTELTFQPPPSLQATPTPEVKSEEGLEEGSSALNLKVCPADPQVCVVKEACPVEQVCSLNTQLCGDVIVSETVLDVSLGPDSTRPTGDLPSAVLDPETPCPVDTNQNGPTPMEVEEAELHPDHPMALRDPQETLEKPREEERSDGSLVLNDPLPLRETQGTDHEQEMVDVQEEVVLKGDTKEEEAAAEMIMDEGVFMEKAETSLAGEAELRPEPLTDPASTEAGSDEGDRLDAQEEKTGVEKEEERKEVLPPAEQPENNDEDLYRGTGEDSSPSSLEVTSMTVENSCSLAPMVDLLSYSQREWRGNTTKSALIRQGYQEMMAWFGGVRRVRGDNYCALRATLFQALSQTTQPPDWLYHHDITTLPEELDGPDGLLSQWTFPGEQQSGDAKRDATQRLKGYIELLRKTWRSAAGCPTADDRQKMCEAVFQGGEEELGLLEALKLLMLGRATELHRLMQHGQEVPVFCWLLFARDTSPCPRTFLTNHLRHVGSSGGLEQVEMFLLGYALRCTIQVYRLYMSGTQEFLIYYPDDHRDDWPSVSLVTEDDRHYNVPVVRATVAPKAASR